MLIKTSAHGNSVTKIQQALRGAGFDVTIDGVFDKQTEAAVRKLQERRFLTVDGVVGSETLEALGLDWVTVAPQAFREEIVRIAEQERRLWQGKIGTAVKMTPVLQGYYLTGVGERVSAKNLQSPAWHASNFWSAVFISWVMKKAGAGDKFAYTKAHKEYIAAAKSNRASMNATNPFWAFPIADLLPEIGDVVCKARANSGATYENIDELGFRATHCDIVVTAESNSVRLIGGNVDNSVKRVTLIADGPGFISLRGNQSGYFSIIRIQEF